VVELQFETHFESSTQEVLASQVLMESQQFFFKQLSQVSSVDDEVHMASFAS